MGGLKIQLSRMFLKSFDVNGLYVMFNFDDSVLFSNIEQLPPFYKAMLKCFNKAYVSDRVVFVNTIMNQPLWGNKFRDFYHTYLQQNLDSIGESSRDYLNRYNITRDDDSYGHVFTKKVKFEKEIKLKEFNFKLLHGILP